MKETKILNIRFDFQEAVTMLQDDKQYQGAVFIKDNNNIIGSYTPSTKDNFIYSMRIVDNHVVIYENENKIDSLPVNIISSINWYLVK